MPSRRGTAPTTAPRPLSVPARLCKTVAYLPLLIKPANASEDKGHDEHDDHQQQYPLSCGVPVVEEAQGRPVRVQAVDLGRASRAAQCQTDRDIEDPERLHHSEEQDQPQEGSQKG